MTPGPLGTSTGATANVSGRTGVLTNATANALLFGATNPALGNFTGGNAANTMRVTVVYTVITP